MMINADKNVEEILMRIRKSELQSMNRADRELQWQSAHPISARLVITPGSTLKMWWDVLMLLLVLISPDADTHGAPGGRFVAHANLTPAPNVEIQFANPIQFAPRAQSRIRTAARVRAR